MHGLKVCAESLMSLHLLRFSSGLVQSSLGFRACAESLLSLHLVRFSSELAVNYL